MSDDKNDIVCHRSFDNAVTKSFASILYMVAFSATRMESIDCDVTFVNDLGAFWDEA